MNTWELAIHQLHGLKPRIKTALGQMLCAYCDKPFTPRQKNQIVCTPACREKLKYKRRRKLS